MADLQHPRAAQQPQRLRRQTNGLPHLRLADAAQHLQPHLGDLLKGMALCRRAVDIFVVIVPERLPLGGLRRLCDGEGHIRLESQQPPIQIGEGDDLLRRQKTPIFLIEAVFLKPTHVVLAAPRILVQCPQRERCPLLGL